MEQNNQAMFYLEIDAKSNSHKTKENCINTFNSMIFRLDGKEVKENNNGKNLKITLSSSENKQEQIKTLMYLQSILFTTKEICSQNSVESFDLIGNINIKNKNDVDVYIIKNSIIRKSDGQIMFPTLLKRLEQAFKEQYLEDHQTSIRQKIKGI